MLKTGTFTIKHEVILLLIYEGVLMLGHFLVEVKIFFKPIHALSFGGNLIDTFVCILLKQSLIYTVINLHTNSMRQTPY
jgi:hypothetical protein